MPDPCTQIAELWSQTQCHLAAKHAAPARTALETLLAIDPEHTLARLALCNLAWRQDRVREAAEHALRAARSVPDYPDLIGETAGALLRVGETVAVRECLQYPALKRVQSDLLLMRLADCWHTLGEHVHALAQMNRARELGFDGDGILYRRSRALIELQRSAEAEPELELAFLLGPAQGEIALALGRLRTQTRERNHLNTLAGGLKNVARGSREHAALEFALYKELEDIGRYDDAWAALTRANALMAQRKRCDIDAMQRWFELCMALCTRETLRPAQVTHEGPQPIFVIGLPQSGTRALAALLGGHPEIADAGEPNDFEQQLRWAADHRNTQDEEFLERVPTLNFEEIGWRYLTQTQWRARGKPYFIDAKPDNWMYAGLIHAALPHARILHVTADPMDVCFAQYRHFFGDTHEYTYALPALAMHHRRCKALMAHWQAHLDGAMQTVACEQLARDPEAVLQSAFAHCGVERCDSMQSPCDAFPSAGAWQPYANHLAALRNWLG